MAMDSPERFVLKPQREGGGNNLYGEDIRLVSCDYCCTALRALLENFLCNSLMYFRNLLAA